MSCLPVSNVGFFSRWHSFGLLALILLLGSCSDGGEAGSYQVKVRVTPYGIPHIQANDWGSLGYGYGYHFASDNLCVMARHILRVRGRLAATFGMSTGEEDNFSSDVGARYFLSDEHIESAWNQQDPRMQQLMRGYADGYSRYLKEIPEGRHPDCRDADWLVPMEPQDVVRFFRYASDTGPLAQPSLMRAVINAQPQQLARKRNRSSNLSLAEPIRVSNALQPPGQGSNAWGLGHYASQNRRPLLLGNPHYPWHGVRRFYQAHLTIPGELDVMGASIFGSPLINIGFNHELAWTHTVSTAVRFTLFELEIHPDNPMQYKYDGVWMPIHTREIAVEVLKDGELMTLNQPLHFTEFGILLDMRESMGGTSLMNWPNARNKAYALRDTSGGSNRFHRDYHQGVQWLEMATAPDLDSFVSSLKKHLGLTFTNTVAIGRKGDTWYGDISAVPYVTDQMSGCQPSTSGQRLSQALSSLRRGNQPFPVLNGSRTDCQWQNSPDSMHPGLMPVSMLPELKTRQYVANSNDSYWMTNLQNPLTGFDNILGGEAYPISLRTQMGLAMINDRLNAVDGKGIRKRFTIDNLKEIALQPRNGAGERFFLEISRVCVENTAIGYSDRLRRGCSALNQWKTTNGIDDRGAMLFNQIWLRIRNLKDLYDVPFNRGQPISTPRNLRVEYLGIQQAILDAIEAEVAVFDANGLDPAAPLGDLQYVVRNGKQIPIPGGPPYTGSFNMAKSKLNGPEGWSEMDYGNSYIQVVTWDRRAENVIAEGILTYSQSTDPSSPNYDNQTQLYSSGGWVELPFSEEAIEASKVEGGEYELTGRARL